MNRIVKYFFIVALLLSGCMGPPSDVVVPDHPDSADPALVQEFKAAFGEFGKEDARKFGGLYLAYSDLILTDTKYKNTTSAREWLETARNKAGMGKYPKFTEAVVRETGPLTENAVLDDEWRKKISEIFKRLGLAALEAGR